MSEYVEFDEEDGGVKGEDKGWYICSVGRSVTRNRTTGHIGDMGEGFIYYSREKTTFIKESAHLRCPGMERLILRTDAVERN